MGGQYLNQVASTVWSVRLFRRGMLRMAQSALGDHVALRVPVEISAILQRLLPTGTAAADRRAHPRRPLTLVVAAVPLNEAHQPVGEPIRLLTRDISLDGIAVIHTERIEHRFLSLSLPLGDTGMRQLVMEVFRSEPLGETGLFDIAGRFVGELA